MIVNGTELLELMPIKDMLNHKADFNGLSYGLTEVGYDIRLAQTIKFYPNYYMDNSYAETVHRENSIEIYNESFCLASSIEEFDMPNHLVGIVHNKSTWARKGINAAFCTVIEPGWKGFLTLEIAYYGNIELIIEAGTPIASIIFHEIACEAEYSGKYQNQPNKPVEAIGV